MSSLIHPSLNLYSWFWCKWICGNISFRGNKVGTFFCDSFSRQLVGKITTWRTNPLDGKSYRTPQVCGVRSLGKTEAAWGYRSLASIYLPIMLNHRTTVPIMGNSPGWELQTITVSTNHFGQIIRKLFFNFLGLIWVGKIWHEAYRKIQVTDNYSQQKLRWNPNNIDLEYVPFVIGFSGAMFDMLVARWVNHYSLKTQWIFQVLVKGGRLHISTQLAVYTA